MYRAVKELTLAIGCSDCCCCSGVRPASVAVSAIFFAEALLLALVGGVAGFSAGALLAHEIGRSIFNSRISIEPVLFPIIIAIAVFVTFAGSAAAIRRAVKFDPVFALRGEG